MSSTSVCNYLSPPKTAIAIFDHHHGDILHTMIVRVSVCIITHFFDTLINIIKHLCRLRRPHVTYHKLYLRQKEFSEAELRDAMEREFAQERASWKRVREIPLNLRLNAILHFV